jgi:hypothetical protein
MAETQPTVEQSPVLQALVTAKSNFGPILKNRTNPFHKSRYADLDSINKAVDAPLLEQGLVITNRLERIDGKLYLVSRLLHTSGKFDETWQQSTCPIADTNKSQELGSSITYATRYNKTALLGVVADEDDDGNSSTVISSGQVSNLVSVAKKYGWDNDEVKALIKTYGFSSASELSLGAYTQIKSELESRVVSKDK